MHLFNINRLAEKLRANTLSETEKYRYLLAILALQALREATRPAFSRPTGSHFATVITVTLISLAGLYLCHKANQSGDNQRLIERFICLSVPINIWVYLFYLCLFYGGFIATQAVVGRAQANSIWATLHSLEILTSSAILSLHFFALIYFIKQIARPQAATSCAPLAAP